MGVVIAAVAGLVVALATALVAESKGQSSLLWFVIGMLLPVVGLVIVSLLRPAPNDDRFPTAGEAVRSSSAARALATRPPLSAHQLAGVSGESEERTIRQLEALEVLGFAQRDAAGRWNLTDEGLEAVANGSSAPP